ncbi:MAG TPA: alpha/beta hydrolase [Mycobacteriales bacterium]|jgi:pimeloyl-ACP methyl ester carboxylesterase|nr:alpha/beta hydrolase [Mycobacteriales bacterium]
MAVPPAPDVVVVHTPHGQVRVRDTGGPGVPVLLVHSLLVDPDLYAAVVPLLVSRGHRCLVPELPLGGHALPLLPGADLTPPGLARLLAEVLDALDVPRAHVVGVDTGGALTQLLMAQHRDRVGLVVLTGCDAYEHFPPPLLAVLGLPLLRGWPGSVVGLAWGVRLRLVRRLLVIRPVTHRGVDDALLRQWTSPLSTAGVRRDLGAVLRAMRPRHTLAAAEANRDFPRPVLIAWGDDDRVFSRRLAERLQRDLPHARLVTLEDCAAFAALDQPDRLAELVDGHLRSHSERAAG